MEIGLWVGNTTVGTGDYMVSVARTAEDLGFDSVWMSDHLLWPEQYATPYPYDESGKYPGTVDTPATELVTAMAWVSAHTERVKIGSCVLVLPQREPWLLAKQIGSLDSLNGGRTILGVGLGWLREEFDVLHAQFDGRADRAVEMLSLLRTAWTTQPATFEGKFWQAPSMGVLPHPVQQPIPIWIGGDSAAARRRVADYGDGWAAFGLAPDRYRSGWCEITERASALDRDPTCLTGMLWAPFLLDPEVGDPIVPLHGRADSLLMQLSAYRDAGVGHFVMYNLAPPEAMCDQLAVIAEDLLPAIHAM
jgi:probable F420-dependent oxidoreductase